MTKDTHPQQAALTRHGEGEARWWFGALAEIKLSAEQTGGRLSVLEITEPPNAEAPLHVHHRDDESFWIVEGDVTFEVGGTTVHARAGDFAFAPHAIPHRYTVGSEGCRMLFIMTPGGFEQLVRDMSVPAQARALPPAVAEEPDWEHIAAVAEAGGCELLQ
jgi:mannose-6-phosphate isomerase-like protein (cupin superfamily)